MTLRARDDASLPCSRPKRARSGQCYLCSLADGWSYIATSPGGIPRNTEITNPAIGAVASYDQTGHPGVLRIPCDPDDLWGSANNTRNSLFRNLPANWLSLQLALSFGRATLNYQQAHLALYQDDDNYVQVGLSYNSSRSGEGMTMDLEAGGLPNAFAAASLTATNIHFRLDRNLATGAITGSYSLNGTNWIVMGTTNQAFVNPRLAIWTGGSPVSYTNGLPTLDLQRLDITISTNIPTTPSYSLVNPPAGARISTNGVIAWTPSEAQGPGTNTIITVVMDNGVPPLSATNSFVVVVNEINTPPVLPAQADRTLTGQQALRVTNTASDADIPTNSLSYQLIGVPAGAAIDTNGVITWTPTVAQVPSTNVFTTIVTDYNPWAINAQHLSATNSFRVTYAVLPGGLGLPAQPDRAVNELNLLVVTNTAFNLSSTNGASASSLVTTNAIVFSYADRSALLADGWSYIATTAGGIPRNTEITNPALGAVVSYDQTAHPGVLRIPCDVGDLWAGVNTSRNSLFRNLPADWVSLRLALAFAPTIDYQQVHLSFYQDDDNFIQAGMAHNDYLGGEITTLVWELGAVPDHFVTALGPVTSIRFRLDRNPSTGDISGYYSFNGVTWNLLGTHNISLANTRLCIWVGGSPVPYAAGLPVCDLQRLEMVSSNSAPTGVLYQLVNAPAGASIDANGIITWTPSEAQGPGTNVITTVATDYNAPGGPASVSNSFTVVVNEVNTAPVLPAQLNRVIGGQTTLTLNNTATDTDIPPNPLSYQLVTAPAGAVIDTNGVITWTPTPNQVPSTNVFTTVVTDFNPWAINAQHLSATNSFMVYVMPGATPNGPALLGQIARTINEQTTLVVTNTAIENLTPSQLATNTYQFAYADRNALLADGWNFLATLPGGAARNTEITNPAVGALTSYDQTAHPRVLRIPCDLGDLWAAANNTRNSLFRSLPANWVSLRLALTFAPVANYQQAHLALYQDDDNYVAAGVAYSGGLKAAQDREVGGLPSTLAAATIAVSNVLLRLDRDAAASTITTFYSVDGTTWVTLQQVSQGLVNPRLCVWVGGSQTAYVADMPVCDLQRLNVVVSNTGPTAVTYQLVNAPAGAAIDGNGIIVWTPTEAQGPATNVLTTVATDNGQPPLSATNSFTVIINEVNQAPVLPVQPNLTISGQTLLVVTNTVTDADIPVNTLAYQLLAAPANALISSNGVITWTPAAGQVPSTNSFVTVVTDSNPIAVNAQHLSATNSFTVTVVPGLPPGGLGTNGAQISIALTYGAANSALQLSFTGTPGHDYQIVWSSQLDGSWTPLAKVTADAQGQVRYTGAKPAATAFFRVLLP